MAKLGYANRGGAALGSDAIRATARRVEQSSPPGPVAHPRFRLADISLLPPPPAARAAIVSHAVLPARLKAGVENLSGMAMDRVRVRYRSPEPARLGALAFARGLHIHLGPGQERHLPHEAWHVVQQAQRRVRPKTQKNGVPLNEDADLEREASIQGAKASRAKATAYERPAPASKLEDPTNISVGFRMPHASSE